MSEETDPEVVWRAWNDPDGETKIVRDANDVLADPQASVNTDDAVGGKAAHTLALMRKRADVSIGNLIKARRTSLGLTQQELSDRLIVPRSQIAAWESARVSLFAGDLPHVARGLQTSPAWLLHELFGSVNPLMGKIQRLTQSDQELVRSLVDALDGKRSRP